MEEKKIMKRVKTDFKKKLLLKMFTTYFINILKANLFKAI